MEEKIQPRGGARAWLVVLAACLVMFVPSYAQMQMSPIAASLMEAYSIDEAQYMSVFTAPNMMPIFLAFIAGILLDRFGTKKTVLVAVSLTCLGCVARVLVVGYVPFYCSSVLLGVATSFITTGAAKLMSQFFPIEKIGLPIGILFAASSVANLIAAATTAYFPSTTSAFVVSAAFAIAAVIVWALLVPSEGKAVEGGVSQGGQPVGIADALKGVLSCKDVYLVIIANMCLGVIGFTVSGMLPTVMASRGLSVTDAGLMASVFALGMLVGAIVTPAVTPKVKNEKVLLVVLSAVLAVLFPLVMVVPVGILLIVLLVVTGVLSYGLVPVLLSLPVRFAKVGVERAGTAGGLITMMQSAGIALLPGNVLIPLAGGDYSILFVFLAGLAALTAVCALLMKIPRM